MNAPHHHEGNEHHAGHGRGARERAAGAAHIDPVCGMTVADDSPRRLDFDGTTYWFCSDHCLRKFSADPAKYVKPGIEPAAADVTYTCPMHPQIRQKGPGNCPICGMALEPVMPSLEEGENPELVDFRRRFWWTLPLTIITVIVAMWGHRLLPASRPACSHGRNSFSPPRSCSGRRGRSSCVAWRRFARAIRTCGR